MAHRPRKRFGQNFLHDPGIIRRIVSAINPKQDEHVVEIGPGEGAITAGLLERCGTLTAIELDRDLVQPLRERLQGQGNLEVLNQDALRFDPCTLVTEQHPRLRLVGNLPYNISTPLLFHLLESVECIRDMHFMLQKEVVTRMAAEPGGSEYGRLSIMIQYHCRVEPLFTIAPGAFRPPPKVDSALVHLVPHPELPEAVPDTRLLSSVVAQAFSQRRKTLANSLKSLLEASEMKELDIDPGMRAQQLSLKDYARITRYLHGR